MQGERQPPMCRAANQLGLALLLLIGADPALAQQVSIYPTEGQTLRQQEIDRLDCDARAVRETGFDPAHLSEPSSQWAANLAQQQRGMRGLEHVLWACSLVTPQPAPECQSAAA